MDTHKLRENKFLSEKGLNEGSSIFFHIIKIKDNLLDMTHYVLRKILGPIISMIWIKKVTGLDNIPSTGGVILAMNHQSYFDFLCLAAISPRNIHFLAAEKFFNHWLWKHLMKTTRQIRVDRRADDKSELHAVVHSHLDDRRVIGLFPEGTRSPHENDMLKAFTGVAQYGLFKKVPIVPVGIKGAFPVMSVHDKKPKFLKNIEIHIGEPIYFSEYHQRNDLTHLDYKAVTHKVMQEISLLSGKRYSHEH
ncbi:MAG: lysophospholipid acyltransferase family protein [Patescibacteria group bacterium]